jgi:hypothetical protein
MRPSGSEQPDDHISREREQLATMLALMLLITFGGAFVLFLIFVSLGLFFWVLVMGAAIAAYAGLHYLVWGRPSNKADVHDESDPASPAPNWPAELLDRRGRRRD